MRNGNSPLRRIAMFLLSVIMVLTLMPSMAFAAGGTFIGEGTEASPYLIDDENDLFKFAEMASAENFAGHALLKKDISLSNPWTAIKTQYITNAFAGVFDGGGHTIKDVTISGSGEQGFFGCVYGGTVKNLTIEGSVNSTNSHAGGIVGKMAFGTIENCSFRGTVITSTSYAGGIAGYEGFSGSTTKTSSISRCANYGSVTGKYAGGITGYVKYGTITDCYNTGRVSGTNRSGGIAGQAQNNVTIENVYNIGANEGTSSTKADIVDFLHSSAKLTNCYYLNGTAPKGDGTGTATDCAVIDKETLLEKLGSAFTADSNNINDGYPVLTWQTGEATVPKDPKIQITGASPLYLSNSGSAPSETISVNYIDMDDTPAITWTITSGEEVISLAPPSDAGESNSKAVITAKKAGKATIKAATADDTFVAEAEVDVYPFITAIDLIGTPVVGDTFSVKVTVYGGSEYDYENYPELKTFTWKYFDSKSDWQSNPGGGTTITGTGRSIEIPKAAGGKWLTVSLFFSGENKTPGSPYGVTVLAEHVPVAGVTIEGADEAGTILNTKAGTTLKAIPTGADDKEPTNVTYQWQRYTEEWDDYWEEDTWVWSNLEGETKQTFTVPEDESAINAQYRVIVSGESDSSATSKIIKVTELSDRLKVNADVNAIKLSGIDKIQETGQITLPAAGENGSAITWVSGKPEFIANDGTVLKLPETGLQEVTLTATATAGEATATKDFVCTLYSEAATEDDKTLSEAADKYALGTLNPVFGTDNNLVAFLQNDLKNKGYEGITVAVDSVERRSYPANGTAAIGENGDIKYFYDDPMTLGNMGKGSYAQFDVTFALTKGDASKKLDKVVNIYWDVDRLCTALNEQILDKLTWDEIKAENTAQDSVIYSLTLPQYLGGKDGGNLLVPISWSSSNETVLSIKDPSGSSDDIAFGPYTGNVTQTFTEQTVTLTATIKYNKLNSGAGVEEDGIAKLKKEFAITIPPLSAEEVLADMQSKLNAGVTAVKFEDFVTKTKLNPDAVVNDVQFTTPGKTGIEGYDNYKFTYSSDNSDVLTVSGYRGNVFRPLPSEGDQNVTVTVIMTSKQNANLSVSSDIPLTVKALTQDEISAASALMDKAVDAYWDGVKGENTDKANITGDLHPFLEMNLGEDGNVVFVYSKNDMTDNGVIPESYVENADGSNDNDYTYFHSSKPAVIEHSTLHILSKPQYDTDVRIESYLTHEVFGKYYTKYRDTDAAKAAEFKKFYRQKASVTVTVKGEDGEDPDPSAKISFNISVNGANGESWIAASEMKAEKDTVLGDVLASFLKDNGLSYTGSMHYIRSITNAKGEKLAEFDHGENSGWMYRVNNTLSDKAIDEYVLQEGDKILLFYTDDYTKEEKTINDGSGDKPSGDDQKKDDSKETAGGGNKPGASSDSSQTDVKVGTTFKLGNFIYKVTNAGEVTLLKNNNKKAKNAVIPAAVSYAGQSYRVTAIANKAFAKNKQLKKVTIGINVRKIGKQAFKGDKKLKKIIFKGKLVKSIGKKAFSGINKKASFKIPKKVLKKYRKKIKKAGAPKTAKYKK